MDVYYGQGSGRKEGMQMYIRACDVEIYFLTSEAAISVSIPNSLTTT